MGAKPESETTSAGAERIPRQRTNKTAEQRPTDAAQKAAPVGQIETATAEKNEDFGFGFPSFRIRFGA